MTLTLTGAGAASASSAFTPSSITGLQAWYKADAGTSTTTDGVAISQWNDQSGNASHAVQATGSLQPLYKAAIQNGLPVVRFDGVDDLLAATAVSIAQPSTIFAVARASANATNDAIFDGATARQHIYLSAAAAVHYYAGTDVASSAVPDTLWHSYSANFNGASSGLWRDGVSISVANPGVGALTSLIIGQNNGSTAAFPGDIAELIFYNSTLSTVNRQSVESYLRTKWATP